LASDPIFQIYQANLTQKMQVFFLPEPAGMLMMGVGVAVLLALYRMRKR